MRRLVVPALLGFVLLGFVLVGCGARDTQGAQTVDTVPVATGTVTATPEVQVAPKLSPHGKDVLARAKRAGAESVVLVISTEPGATDRVAADVQRLSATVEASDATVGYVRVSVPVDLAEEVTTVEGVRQVDVDEPLSNIDPTP